MNTLFATLLSFSMISFQVVAQESQEIRLGREIQKAWWDSIETLSFDCYETYDNTPAPNDSDHVVGLLHKFQQARYGKRSYELIQIWKSGRTNLIENFREDGNSQYQVAYFKDGNQDPSRLKIRNQTNKHNNYDSVMSSAHWLIMPGGIPLADLTRDPGYPEQPSTGTSISLVIRQPGRTFVCVLDPKHDWLPEKVYFKNYPAVFWKATSFLRKSGHWFPEKGEFSAMARGTTYSGHFEIKNLEINTPIPKSAFLPPKLPDGVVISDVSKLRGRIQVSNNTLSKKERFQLREQLILKNTRSTSSPSTSANQVTASRVPPSFPWSQTFLGLGMLSILGVVILKRRAITQVR